MRPPRNVTVMRSENVNDGVVVTWYVDRLGRPREYKTLATIGTRHGEMMTWDSERAAIDGHDQAVAKLRTMI